jgi:hypothetical protein
MAEPNYTITLDQLMKLQDALNDRAAAAFENWRMATNDEDRAFFSGVKRGFNCAADEVGAFTYALSIGEKGHGTKA